MNYPAASYGVSWPKRVSYSWRSRRYSLARPCSLTYSEIRPLVIRFADGIDEVPLCPKLASPQSFLHRRNPDKDFARRAALDTLRYLRGTVHRHGLNQKMNMLPVHTNLQKLYLITLGYLQTDLFQNRIHLICEDDTAIFGRTHQMIQQYRYVMAFVNILAHRALISYQLRRSKLRGIYAE